MLRAIVLLLALTYSLGVGAYAQRPATPPQPGTTSGPQVSPTFGPPSPSPRKPPPPLRLLWKMPIESATFRIAAADLQGDGKMRLATMALAAKGVMRIGIAKWDGARFQSEWSMDLSGVQPLMAVGRFVEGDKAAQIVTQSGYVRWDGRRYKWTDSVRPLVPVGVVAHRRGGESLLLKTSLGYGTYRITPGQDEEDWLSESGGLATGADVDREYQWGVFHATGRDMQNALPPEYVASGVILMWDAIKEGKVARYTCKYIEQAEKPGAFVVQLDQMSPGAAKEVWCSEALDGLIGDLAIGDPKGDGKTGLMVLAASDSKGSGRTLYLFAPSPTVRR